ncbi:MAG: SpoIIE family protein phosphatase, partial [Promethearchaeota archaeon]
MLSCANQEAENRYRKALKLVRSETERAPLLSGLGQALYWQSRFAEAIQVWCEGIDLYRTLGPEGSDGVARLYARSARAAWSGGDTPESLRLCQEGMAALASAPASPGLALLLHETARAYLFNGLPGEARPLCQQALEMAEHLGIVEVQAEALATLGLLSDQPPEVALAVLTQALELAESAGLLSQAARAHVNLASLLSTTLPDFRAAHGHYQRAAELHRLRGNTAGELFARGGMTSVSLLLGDFEEAEATLPMLRQLLDQVADPGPAVFHIRDIEALLLRYQGELAMAARLLRALQTEERHRGNLQNLIDVNNQLAEVLLEPYVLSGSVEVDDDSHPARQGWEVAEAALEEAEAALVEAIAICDRWSTGRVWPRCLLSMVRTCQGRFEDAHRLLAEAREVVNSPPTAFDEVRLSLAEARLTAAEERWPEALAAFEAAAGIYARLGLRWWRARMLQEWAEVHFSRREPTDLERAQVLFREALATFEELGISRYAALVADRLPTLRAATYAQALAHQKAAQELAVAGRIQESFLPAEPPRVPGWQLTATLEPARETSGDFYDFIPLPNGRLGIVIADVADKGAGAALYMTLSRTLIRTYAAEYDTQPELVLGAVNRRILGDTQADLFVTVFYGILDPATGRLTYSNAGHNPPILLRARDGAAMPTLRKTGTPLGIWAELTWGQQMVQLAPGDSLVLYTDGVTDAENEEVVFFGPERLLAV